MTDAELARYYPDDYWGNADEPSQKWIESSQSEKTRFLNDLFCGSALSQISILDVGCGAGFFLRALNSKKWDPYGVEISQSAAKVAERALGGGHVFAGGLIDGAWPDSKFDVVTLWSA
ncbi:MAG TPA: class I SAM-dependent methyltransferase, partial [Blastocatellia bacterium]|nr:class I SAM-dependent methyltransferase [Blastocatellia bacterium]